MTGSAWLLVVAYYGVVSVKDIRQRRIPTSLSVLGLFLGGLIGFWAHGWQSSLIGGVIAVLLLELVFLSGKGWAAWIARRRRLTAPPEVFGFGDVLLGGVSGLFLGWPLIMTGLGWAAIFAFLFGTARIGLALLRGEAWRELSLPLAPFLAAGTLVAAIYTVRV